MKKIKIVYINLDKRGHKRNLMETYLSGLQTQANRIAAIDGNTLSRLEQLRLNENAKRPLRSGELGCFLSHRMAWCENLEMDQDYLWVLEDDVAISSEIEKYLIEVIRKLDESGGFNILYVKERSTTKSFYDICDPIHIEPELETKNPINDQKCFGNVYSCGPQIGAYSYVLTKSGLRECFEKTKAIQNPVDVQLAQIFTGRGQFLWISEYVLLDINSPSDTSPS